MNDLSDVLDPQGVPSNTPTAALHSVDNHPGNISKLLAGDRRYHIRDSLNELLCLFLREFIFEHLDFNERHCFSPFRSHIFDEQLSLG
jgi:hypothetical protein